MPLTLTWQEIALRLALSAVAGTLIGLDRGERGRPAGLRTTLLVCLAAAVAMIQANLLLATVGKAADSFISLDLMRLPLGILTGMGFIGAGAVIRRDGLILGVTTAATLWFVTVIGLCFGGGQISLGIAGLLLGLIVVSGLHWIEYRMTQDQHATLSLKPIATSRPNKKSLARSRRLDTRSKFPRSPTSISRSSANSNSCCSGGFRSRNWMCRRSCENYPAIRTC